MVSYEYYRDAYRGEQVPEEAFGIWVMRAQERVSADTCGRSDGILLAALALEQTGGAVSKLGEQVRRAVCAVTDLLYRTHDEERKRGVLASETVGGWSRSYAARDAKAAARQVRAAQLIYLGGTGLLYRGQ